MELGLSKTLNSPVDLSIIGQGMSVNKGRPKSGGPSRPLSRPSHAESLGSLANFCQHASYGGAYDPNVPPSELRTQNLYIQSLQHRQPQVG